MSKKTMLPLVATGLVFAIAASTSQPAEARRGGPAAGVAVGTVLGLGIAGVYTVPRYLYLSCRAIPLQCGWVGRTCAYDRWGDHVCQGGTWRCQRPTNCSGLTGVIKTGQ
jgi:hypothetical protein